MNDRITKDDLNRIAATVSDGLRDGLHVVVSGRNGYSAADLYDTRNLLIDTLRIGTKRDVYGYLQGMRQALLITNRL